MKVFAGMSQTAARTHADESAAIAIEQATDPYVRLAANYWRSLCGHRRVPARDDLTLRGMAAFLPHAVIVRVIDGGADFEYRYVGEAQRQAFKTPFKGVHVSQIEAAAPQFGILLRTTYEQARSSGLAFAMRGRIDQGPPGSKPLYHETIFLPLGSDAGVDHLLIVGVQIPEPFWDIPADKLKVFEE